MPLPVWVSPQKPERRENATGTAVYYYAYWLAEMNANDRVGQSHWRHILECSCGGVEHATDATGSAGFVTVALTGNGFMIHQVRVHLPTITHTTRNGAEGQRLANIDVG
jgi:tRNA U38,U39,U40 pseudouridine synthase TruA